jgi:hypothetical protein
MAHSSETGIERVYGETSVAEAVRNPGSWSRRTRVSERVVDDLKRVLRQSRPALAAASFPHAIETPPKEDDDSCGRLVAAVRPVQRRFPRRG